MRNELAILCAFGAVVGLAVVLVAIIGAGMMAANGMGIG